MSEDIRWAVNVLLEKIAVKFEAWDTMDLWRSDAAQTVRSFKHDLAAPGFPAQSKPTVIKDFPGRAVAAHLAATGTLPGETLNEIKFVHDELKTAIRHIEHMSAWIGKQNAGYSFESLGEDMPSIRAALECARVHSACKEQDDRDSADLREALEAIKPGPSDALSPHDSAEGDLLGDLTKLAAECHRAKWAYDLGEDEKPSASRARSLILQAFGDLHRIGDYVLSLRDEAKKRTASPLSQEENT